MKHMFCLVILVLVGVWATSANGSLNDLRNEGVGIYTDASVANQISTFTINRQMVSCGVGTVTAGGLSGPFAMLMYAKDIQSYRANQSIGTIRATGRMRSITQIIGVTVEDIEHHFLAIAVDADSNGTDRFDINFVTPFWNTGNLMCIPSTEVAGGCRFGGELLLGEVTVGP